MVGTPGESKGIRECLSRPKYLLGSANPLVAVDATAWDEMSPPWATSPPTLESCEVDRSRQSARPGRVPPYRSSSRPADHIETTQLELRPRIWLRWSSSEATDSDVVDGVV